MSTLARADALCAASGTTWRALRARLEALRYEEAHIAVLGLGKGVPIELRGAIRRAHLRRSGDAASHALRLFAFEEAITEAEARDALTAPLFEALTAADAIAPTPEGRHASKLLIQPSEGLLVLSDPLHQGGDAVMGPGSTTTALFHAALRDAVPTGVALDLGCGAGTAALHLARRGGRVIGTDINPRAVRLAKINATFNAIDNVEIVTGDLFAPVSGTRFDLVVSQPPFVAMPEGAAEVAFLYGGARGDELARRLLSELPAHVAPGGRAIILTQWPLVDERSVTDRVREALGVARFTLLSLQPKPLPLDDYCASYAAFAHASFDADYRAETRRFRAHMDRIGARGIEQALLVLADEPAPFDATVPLWSRKIVRLRGDRIDARLGVERALREPRAALLARDLRLTEGLHIEQIVPAAGAAPTFAIETEDPLVEPSRWNAPTRDLLLAVDAEESVGRAIELVAARHRVPASKAVATLAPIVEGALRQGLLTLRAR